MFNKDILSQIYASAFLSQNFGKVVETYRYFVSL